MAGGAAAIFGSVIGAGAGLLGGYLDRRFQERMQEESWEREDTAVQRRVADLEAAGLNPVLAAGSAAQSSAPMRMQSLSDSAKQGADLGLAVMQMKDQFANTKAQRDLLRAQARKMSADAMVSEATIADRITLQRVKADFEETMTGTKMAMLQANAGKARSEAEMSYENKRFVELYGSRKAEAEMLLAEIEARVRSETKLSYEQQRVLALELANQFMSKNNEWYVYNHTINPIMQGVRTVAPLMTE